MPIAKMRTFYHHRLRAVGAAVLAAAIGLAALGAFSLSLPAQAEGDAFLSFQSNPATINGCGTTTVDVWINDITLAYAADFEMHFDPSALEVVDAMPYMPGVQNQPLYTFMDSGFVLRNEVTNTTGWMWYAFTQLSPSVGKTGSGPLLRITFRAKKAGPSTLSFTRSLFADYNTHAITPTFTTSTVNAIAPPSPTLHITQTNATDARLWWNSISGVSGYSLYRDTTPYFDPSTATRLVETTNLEYHDLNILGDVNEQHYYTLRANCPAGLQSANTNRVGEYDWALRSAAVSNMNDVSWVFKNPSIAKASQLRAAIGGSVIQISKFDPSTQTFVVFAPPSTFSDFALDPGMFLFIKTSNTAPASFTMVGNVPDPGSVKFNLAGGTSGKLNYLSVPLDHSDINTGYAAYMQAGSGVIKVTKFNASTQTYIVYTPPFPFNDFPLVIGEPFIFMMSASTPPEWP